MKLVFSHDSLLRKDSKGNYYSTTLNDDAFKRYNDIANEITIIMRSKKFNQDSESKNYSRIQLKNLTVVETPDISNLRGQIKNKILARKIIKSELVDADYVVVRLPSFLGMLTYDIAKKMGKPCLVEVVGCAWDAYWNHSLQGKVIAPIMYLGSKYRIERAKYVVYVTNLFLQKRYPTKGKNINASNVVLTDFDEKILEKRIQKISRKKDSEKIIIGTTAAVNVRYKGQEYIIRAISKLKKQGYMNYEYQLVGNGDQTYLRTIAYKYNVSDQVLFLGTKRHSEVFSWLDSLDIYAQPSKQEGLPRALIEAMSRGIPSIGAHTAGIPELIESRYIFSNSKENIDEICKILLSLNKEKLVETSKRNYLESKKYDKNLIATRRGLFFKDFKNQIK